MKSCTSNVDLEIYSQFLCFRMRNGSDCSSVKVFLGGKKGLMINRLTLQWFSHNLRHQARVLMTNKQHSINYTISKGIYGRNNQRRAKGERRLFFTKTECHEPRVKRVFCSFTFILLYFVPTFNITERNTLDSISQSIPFSLLQAAWVK